MVGIEATDTQTDRTTAILLDGLRAHANDDVVARHQDGCTRKQNRLARGSLKTQILPRDKRRARRAPHDSAVGTKGAQS